MTQPKRTFAWYGWLGILGLAAGEALILQGNRWVVTWFTPLMWTAYILTVDAFVARRTGTSWLSTRRREVPLLVLLSVGIWVLFEAYNFPLKNWQYVHVPADALVRLVAFFWSFATIMPGVFETADLLGAVRPAAPAPPPRTIRPTVGRAMALVLGLGMVTVPLAVPQSIAPYLFACVWIGFVPLLEPLNLALGAPCPTSDWLRGDHRPVAALLIAGLACGLLWEAWNYQAFLHQGAYWVYTIPQPLRLFGLHYGQMPVLGLGGFPPFALELAAFYSFFKRVLGGERVFGPHETPGGAAMHAPR